MKRVINQLFLRMSSIYGNKWTSSFSSEEIENFAKREWYDALVSNNLTPEQIRQGLDKCRDERKWPPTIAEFISLAKPPVTDAMHKEFDKQLPPPRVPPEVVKENLRKIRAILNGGDVLKDPYSE